MKEKRSTDKMRYCADTWFILKLFSQDSRALQILNNAKYGKDYIFISLIVFAESTKKLLQLNATQERIDNFFEAVENSEKVQMIDPDKVIAKEAAKISLSYSVPMMDSFVAATAKTAQCDILLAKDSDFKILEKRKYIKVQSW